MITTILGLLLFLVVATSLFCWLLLRSCSGSEHMVERLRKAGL